MRRFRKENKYFVTDIKLGILENRLKGMLARDKNQNGEAYLIRSVYFDSPADICVRENEAGIGEREKYRIRTYDASDAFIRAEIKIRSHDAVAKESAEISRDELYGMLGGEVLSDKGPPYLGSEEAGSPNEEPAADVLDRFRLKLSGEGYRPKAIVEYERTAYVYEPCNVRITFDRNVSASASYGSLFDRNLCGVPVLDGGIQILEVKYDEFLPEEIKLLLAGMNLRRCSCSKYYLSRQRLALLKMK